MTQQNHWLEIIDKDGWQKDQPLEKRIVFIGSDPSNDICLLGDRGMGVAPRHIQLILNQTGYNLVNLSEENVIVHTPGVQLILPHRAMNVTDGYSILLGNYTLTLRSGKGGWINTNQTTTRPVIVDAENSEQKIALEIILPTTQLAPHKQLNGIVIVRNLGEVSGAKINLELRGVDPECYHLDSGPLLSSGAEQKVHFHLNHLGHLPTAGPLEIEIEASALKAYPKALPASASQTVEVLPYYNHTLTLRDPETVLAQSASLPAETPSSQPVEEVPSPVSSTSIPPQPEPQIAPSLKPVLSKMEKVPSITDSEKKASEISKTPPEIPKQILEPSPNVQPAVSPTIPQSAEHQNPSHDKEPQEVILVENNLIEKPAKKVTKVPALFEKPVEKPKEKPTEKSEPVSSKKETESNPVEKPKLVLPKSAPEKKSKQVPPIAISEMNPVEKPEPVLSKRETEEKPVEKPKQVSPKPTPKSNPVEKAKQVPSKMAAERKPRIEPASPAPSFKEKPSTKELPKDAIPMRNTAPQTDSERSKKEAWWLVEEEEIVVEKQRVMKIQSKSKPTSSTVKKKPSSLIDDWVADDED
ncbi:MAG: hypothetical protein KDJ52_02960 [Anaerolineae bacterium]|nr:hypothetical protein [Anaerolineae bacterium]